MRNVATCVERMLDSLLFQDRSHTIGMELIVVDDASEDGSADIAAAWSAKRNMPVTLIRNSRRIWSYGSRLKGFACANAPHIWCVDADDRVPEEANLGLPLHLAQETGCDIVHCRAVGIRPPSPLYLPLSWTEPVALKLSGKEIFSAFMSQAYPPGTLCNKILSRRLAESILAHAPSIEVRYFDVKFFGLLAPLLAESYQASNETIYEYTMRTIRPAELYSRQVAGMLALAAHLGPIIADRRPDMTAVFEDYCRRRLVIQTGHLAIMCEHELGGIPSAAMPAWFEKNIYANISKRDLLRSLFTSIGANAARLRKYGDMALAFLGCHLPRPSFLPPDTDRLSALALRWQQGEASVDEVAALVLTAVALVQAPESLSLEKSTGLYDILGLLLANARLAKILTSMLAPETDITKMAN